MTFNTFVNTTNKIILISFKVAISNKVNAKDNKKLCENYYTIILTV